MMLPIVDYLEREKARREGTRAPQQIYVELEQEPMPEIQKDQQKEERGVIVFEI